MCEEQLRLPLRHHVEDDLIIRAAENEVRVGASSEQEKKLNKKAMMYVCMYTYYAQESV